MRLLFLLLLLSGNIAFSQNLSVEEIIALDPDSSPGPRGRVEGAFQTELGLQIHPVCMERLRDNWTNSANLEDTINSWINGLTSRFLNKCLFHYSELGDLSRNWLTQMRRGILVCGSEDSGANMSMIANTSILRGQTSRADRRGIQQGNPNDSFSKQKAVVVVVYPKGLSRLINSLDFQADLDNRKASEVGISLFAEPSIVHEFLHAVGADTNGVSRHLEAQKFEYNDFQQYVCESVRYADRVNFLTQLCTSPFPNTAEQMMYVADSECSYESEKSYCEDLMAARQSFLSSVITGTERFSLNSDQASKICKKILEKGKEDHISYLTRQINYIIRRNRSKLCSSE